MARQSIAFSSDDGKTWSAPQHVMGQATPLEEYAPGVKPNQRGSTPYDRPSLATDLSTGTIYVPGSGTGPRPGTLGDFHSRLKGQRKDLGLIYSYDSPDYPQGGMGSRASAANGALAVAYVASSVPASAGAAARSLRCVRRQVAR